MNTRTLLAAAVAALFAIATPSAHADGTPYVAADEEGEAAPDPAQLERWKTLIQETAGRQRKAYENLKASASPRDWAVASQIPVHEMSFGADGKPVFDSDKAEKRDADRAELLRNAAAGAPSDKLVQWLALNEMPHVGGGCSSSALPAERVEAVQGLEPDNGLAWLPTLKAAAVAKDDFVIDQTLARMAAAKRYDNHVIDYTLALMDVARREPGLFGVPMDAEESDVTPEDAASLTAYFYGRTLSTNEGDFGDVCDAAKQLDADIRRFAACGDLGRRLSREATTGELRMQGFALLRQSGLLDDEDAAQERDLMWLAYQARTLMSGDDEKLTAAAVLEAKTLWVANPDDIAVLRTMLERRGMPVTPPPGWQPPHQSEQATR